MAEKPKPETETETNHRLILDWDSYLYSLWLENMTLNPGLFDDARISHTSGHVSAAVLVTQVG